MGCAGLRSVRGRSVAGVLVPRLPLSRWVQRAYRQGRGIGAAMAPNTGRVLGLVNIFLGIGGKHLTFVRKCAHNLGVGRAAFPLWRFIVRGSSWLSALTAGNSCGRLAPIVITHGRARRTGKTLVTRGRLSYLMAVWFLIKIIVRRRRTRARRLPRGPWGLVGFNS